MCNCHLKVALFRQQLMPFFKLPKSKTGYKEYSVFCCGVRGEALASHNGVCGFEPQCGGRLSSLSCWQLYGGINVSYSLRNTLKTDRIRRHF